MTDLYKKYIEGKSSTTGSPMYQSMKTKEVQEEAQRKIREWTQRNNQFATRAQSRYATSVKPADSIDPKGMLKNYTMNVNTWTTDKAPVGDGSYNTPQFNLSGDYISGYKDDAIEWNAYAKVEGDFLRDTAQEITDYVTANRQYLGDDYVNAWIDLSNQSAEGRQSVADLAEYEHKLFGGFDSEEDFASHYKTATADYNRENNMFITMQLDKDQYGELEKDYWDAVGHASDLQAQYYRWNLESSQARNYPNPEDYDDYLRDKDAFKKKIADAEAEVERTKKLMDDFESTRFQSYGGYDNFAKAYKEQHDFVKELEAIETHNNLLNVKSNEDYDSMVAQGREKGNKKAFDGEKFDYEVALRIEDKEYPIIYRRENMLYGVDAYTSDEAKNQILIAKHMTDDEYNAYLYHVGRGDTATAQQLLDYIEADIVNREASSNYEFWGGDDAHALGQIALQLGYGVGGWFDSLSAYSGEDKSISATAKQVTSSMISESLDDKGLGLASDLAYTIGNQVPSIIASTITTALTGNPMAGSLVGNVGMGASAAGNAYYQAKDMGYTDGEAWSYGALVGGSEVAIGTMLSGVAAMGGRLTGKGISALTDNIDDVALRVGTSKIGQVATKALKIGVEHGGRMVSEFGEEYLQAVLEPFYQNVIFGTDYSVNPFSKEALEAGLLGALSAGVINTSQSALQTGVNAINKARKYTQVGKTLTNADITAEKLKNVGTLFSADSIAHKLAGKVDENTGAYTIGKLFNEMKATMSEQNKTEIVAKLVSQGVAQVDADILVDAVELSMVAGVDVFNANERYILENNPTLSKAVREVLIDSNSTTYQRIEGMKDVQQQLAQGQTQRTAPTDTATAPTEAVTEPVIDEMTTDVATEEVVTEAVTEPETRAVKEVAEDAPKKIAQKDESAVASVITDEDGNISYKTEDGDTVDAKNAKFKNADEAVIYEIGTEMGMSPAAINFAVNNYDADITDAVNYMYEFRTAYQYGAMGVHEAYVDSADALSSLSYKQRKDAYELGKTLATDEVASRQRMLDDKRTNDKTKRKGSITLDGKTYDVDADNSLTEIQRESIKAARVIADVLGIDINLFESYVATEGANKGKRVYKRDGKEVVAPNGYYSPDGSINIDINAGSQGQGLILETLGHELTHFIRQWSPSKFKALSDFLIEQYHAKNIDTMTLVNQQIAKAKDDGRAIDFDTAYEEVIADSFARMLTDGQVISKLAKTDKGLYNKIKTWIKDFVSKVKELYSHHSPETAEALYVSYMTDVATNLQTMWHEALVDAGETYSDLYNALGKDGVVEVNAEGQVLLGKSNDGKLVYNARTYNEGGRTALENTLRSEGFSNEDIRAALTILDGQMELVERIAKEGNTEQDKINKATLTTDVKNGHAVLSALVSNGDYPVNIDLLMICKKRQAYQQVINRLCDAGIIEYASLDSLAIAEINKILGKHGFETACLGCFVESRRLRIQEWAETICSEWNGIVDDMVGKGKSEAFGFASDTFVNDLSDAEVQALSNELESAYERDALHYGKTAVVKKMRKLLTEVPALRKRLTVADLITPTGRTHLRSLSAELNSLVACRYGSNTPKIVQDFNPYNHELAEYNDYSKTKYNSFREYLYAIGGARMQSFSDFIVENWFDYCQIVADLSARKLPMHTYTKEMSLVKLFGLTGIKINMSLIPDVDKSLSKEYAGLTQDENGNYKLIWADKTRHKETGGKTYMQSIDYNEAIAIQNDPRYSSNVGTIAIGVSRKQIEMMLDDNNIRMIIPYHSSGMNPVFAHLVGIKNYQDFTDVQNTRIKKLYNEDGKAVSRSLTKTQRTNLTSGFEFNKTLQELGDARLAAEEYKKWCKDKTKHSIEIKGVKYYAELTPKFDEFAEHENYYKVLEDFNVYDSITGEPAPQRDVQQIFPENFEEMLRSELEGRQKYRKKQDPKWETAMNEIVDYLQDHTRMDTVRFAKEQDINMSAEDKARARKEEKALIKSPRPKFFLDHIETQEKFSMRSSVEATKDLVAFHNLNAQQLLDVLNTGHITMPSIAVTNKGMTDFGEYSIILPREVIDPKLGAKLFGADAWTPTQIKLKMNAKFSADNTVNTLNRLKKTLGAKASKELLNLDAKEFQKTIKDNDGSMYLAFDEHVGMKTAFALENDIITEIPMKNGKVDTAKLQDIISNRVHKDEVWRTYKSWLDDISNHIITHYDEATQEDIMRNMKAQPATNKKFKLSVDGGLIVPAVEYQSVEEAISNKHRLSEDAEAQTQAVADEFLVLAEDIARNTGTTIDDVVNAINNAYDSRYSVEDIVSIFRRRGISINNSTARKVQKMYRKSVELPTRYFEGKAQRAVGIKEFAVVIIPSNAPEVVREGLAKAGLSTREYKEGQNNKRIEAINSFEHAKFSTRGKAPTFYSQMGKVIDGIKVAKMGAKDVIHYLRGKGVKAEEIKWSGLETFLEGKKSVTKQELQEFVAGSQLQIQEKVRKKKKLKAVQISDTEAVLMDGDRELERFHREDADLEWQTVDGNGYFDSLEEIEQAGEYEHKETKWEEHAINGGKNYREIEFVLPDSTYTNDAMRNHWGEKAQGVLAHARVQDLDTPTGKMLFIEEIQSDWHNQGSRAGYISQNDVDYKPELVDDRAPDAPFKDNYHEYVLKRLIRQASEEGYASIGWTTADIQVKRWHEQYRKKYEIEYDQDIPKFLRKYGKKWGATVSQTTLNNQSDVAEYVDANGKTYKGIREWYDSVMDSYAIKHHSVWEDYISGRVKVIQDGDTMRIQLKKTGKLLDEKLTVSYVPDTVWSMDITDSMRESVITEGQPMYSTRAKDGGLSTRNLLANALDSVAETDADKKVLADYKANVDKMSEVQQRLTEVRARIKELSFGKGERDTAQLTNLQKTAKDLAKLLNSYDKKLLKLEATDSLARVIEYEKKQALKRGKEKGADVVKDIRTRATKVDMRNKVKKSVNNLNKLLLNPTKDKHVQVYYQKAVAQMLEVINMDEQARIARAEKRMTDTEAKYSKLLDEERAKDNPDAELIEFYETKIARSKSSAGRVAESIQALKDAYHKITTSDNPNYVNSPEVEALLDGYAEFVGDTALSDMSLQQLDYVYNSVKIVDHMVREANKGHKLNRNKTISDYNAEAVNEIKSGHDTQTSKLRSIKIGKSRFNIPSLDNFRWDYQKPWYAIRKLGSETMNTLYDNIRKGEDIWARDFVNAQNKAEELAKKYNIDKWDFSEKIPVGNTEITLDQLFSLYAYSKRQAADKHLAEGGFVFDSSVKLKKNKKGIFEYQVNLDDSHKISQVELIELVSNLTEEQRAWVDEMQSYLSNDLSAIGNEVSRELYGIELFKEEFYFPIKSMQEVLDFNAEQHADMIPNIANMGMTKPTKPNANNTIILGNFSEVWAKHCNDMGKYHAFALAMDDFTKVYNFGKGAKGYDSSLKVAIKNAKGLGDAANRYIQNLLRDINGGVRMDEMQGIDVLISKFKKASVMASASVTIQQPSAIGRAFGVINPKYFVKTDTDIHKHSTTVAEMEKYAPIAVIKRIGGFDTGMSGKTTDMILGKDNEGISNKFNNALGYAPAKADEITWCAIWNACKRETKAKYNLEGEALLEKAGERFTEVVQMTQVYDSVFSRNAMMRSKSKFNKMATSFMAEPITTLNSTMYAIDQIRQGNIKNGSAMLAGNLSSIVINSLLSSVVYGWRDDDEDKTYLEKFASSAVNEMVEGINPITYIPIVKDVWSLLQGYDVERVDMSVLSDSIDKLQRLVSAYSNLDDDMTDEAMAEAQARINDAWIDLGFEVLNLFGIPADNVRREVVGITNTVTADNDFETTLSTLWDAIKTKVVSGLPIVNKMSSEDKVDKLYNALADGDTEMVKRIKSTYTSDKAYESAMTKGLKENDERIQAAAQAGYEGDVTERVRIAREIIAEGIYTQDMVVTAINSEINRLKKGEPEQVDDTPQYESVSDYTASDINSALEYGDMNGAKTIIEELVKDRTNKYLFEAEAKGEKLKERDAEEKARKSLKSTVTSHWKDKYIEAYVNKDDTELKRIRTMLADTGLWKRKSEVSEMCREWLKDYRRSR